ncbi:MAG: hypothetical protein M3O35_05695 [Acidobacteriota bacterium]|nr:hypothetical protein [Acidobacteriota bacterium]
MTKAILQRLAAAGFQILPALEITTHYVLERDGIVALVERIHDGFGGMGSPGLLTEKGFAALVRSAEGAFFVAKGYREPASEQQIRKVRAFSEDLGRALSG